MGIIITWLVIVFWHVVNRRCIALSSVGKLRKISGTDGFRYAQVPEGVYIDSWLFHNFYGHHHHLTFDCVLALRMSYATSIDHQPVSWSKGSWGVTVTVLWKLRSPSKGCSLGFRYLDWLDVKPRLWRLTDVRLVINRRCIASSSVCKLSKFMVLSAM